MTDRRVISLKSTSPSKAVTPEVARTVFLALALRHGRGTLDASSSAVEQSGNAAGARVAGQGNAAQARSGCVLARALAAAELGQRADSGEEGGGSGGSSEKHPLPPPCPQTASGAAELPPLENSRPNESKTSQPPAFGGRPGHGT